MSNSWDHLLAADEEIIWQGAPKAKVRLEWESPAHPFFYLFFTGFSIFWMSGASQAGGFLWTFGLLFFGVGMFNLVGIHFWKAFLRTREHYTLTNKRAFIASSAFGKKLESYPITDTTQISLAEAGGTGDVYFAQKEKRGKNGATFVKIGFSQIEDPRKVWALMCGLQQAA